MIRRNEKGFTLVELLIVVAIIGILAGVVLIAINPGETLRKSRDATRLSDLDSVARALNLALAEETVTLVATSGGSSSLSGATPTAVNGNGWVDADPVGTSAGLGQYLSALPLAPNHSAATPEAYIFYSDGVNYELNAVLEATDNEVKMVNDGGNENDVNGALTYEIGTDPGLDLDLTN